MPVDLSGAGAPNGHCVDAVTRSMQRVNDALQQQHSVMNGLRAGLGAADLLPVTAVPCTPTNCRASRALTWAANAKAAAALPTPVRPSPTSTSISTSTATPEAPTHLPVR